MASMKKVRGADDIADAVRPRHTATVVEPPRPISGDLGVREQVVCEPWRPFVHTHRAATVLLYADLLFTQPLLVLVPVTVSAIYGSGSAPAASSAPSSAASSAAVGLLGGLTF